MDTKKNIVKIGFTVDYYQSYTPARIIQGLRLLGVEFVELTPSIFQDVTGAAKRLRGMQTAFHLPILQTDGWDFATVDREFEINTIIRNINEHRQALGIHHVIAHPPERHMSADEKFWLKNLQELHPPIFLENIPDYSIADFQKIYSETQNSLDGRLFGMCFDAAHYYLSGTDPLQQYSAVKEKIGCIHLSDCIENDDAHLPFGLNGVLPIQELLALVQQTDFNGYITLEIKPRSIAEIDSYVNSYLLTLKYLRYSKYITTKIRYWLMRLFMKNYIMRTTVVDR